MIARLFSKNPVSPSERRLRQFARNKWPRRDSRAPVILVSLYDVPISVASVGVGANLLADEAGARLGAFCFEEKPDSRLAALYRDLGAPLVLQSGKCSETAARALRAADDLLRGISSKEELIKATYGDLLIGDLIYDSYLRHEALPTVDLAAPNLRGITAKVFESLFLCERFFAENKVLAVIPDHVVYLRGGAISRFAASRGVPVLLPGFREKFSFRSAQWIDAGGGRKALYNFDFEGFRAYFASLSPEEQDRARTLARQHLEHILTGAASPVEGMNSPFAPPSSTRLLPDTGRPRMLIMLHEFCDAPHCLGHMLYPDFLEWIHDTLKVASETDFDWFVKPHACLLMKGRRAINEVNRRVVEELKASYPKVTFLAPDTSNRQILQDGISAMFTLHGSAGYEFSYMGVPVVTAGNTHYRQFDFTVNPDSIEEYRSWIRRADAVPHKMDRRAIEEFYYCLLVHTKWGKGEGAPLFPREVFAPGFDRSKLDSAAIYDVVLDGLTPQSEAELRAHFREFSQTLPRS